MSSTFQMNKQQVHTMFMSEDRMKLGNLLKKILSTLKI